MPLSCYQDYIGLIGICVDLVCTFVANQHTTRDRVVAGELRDTYRRKPGGSITLNPNTISVFHLIVVFVADIWGTTIILCAPHGNVILTIVANEVFSAKPFINITNIGIMRFCAIQCSSRIYFSICRYFVIYIDPFRHIRIGVIGAILKTANTGFTGVNKSVWQIIRHSQMRGNQIRYPIHYKRGWAITWVHCIVWYIWRLLKQYRNSDAHYQTQAGGDTRSRNTWVMRWRRVGLLWADWMNCSSVPSFWRSSPA